MSDHLVHSLHQTLNLCDPLHEPLFIIVCYEPCEDRTSVQFKVAFPDGTTGPESQWIAN